jgi:arylsulfatase A-like enzyme
MLMDWFPTLCEAAAVPVDHEIEGHSILPVLVGETVDFAERTFYWVRREGWHGQRRYMGQDYHAVRKGNVKLLHNDAFAPLELYDLGRDEREAHDLIDDEHPLLMELCESMQEHIRLAGAVPWQKREE